MSERRTSAVLDRQSAQGLDHTAARPWKVDFENGPDMAISGNVVDEYEIEVDDRKIAEIV